MCDCVILLCARYPHFTVHCCSPVVNVHPLPRRANDRARDTSGSAMRVTAQYKYEVPNAFWMIRGGNVDLKPVWGKRFWEWSEPAISTAMVELEGMYIELSVCVCVFVFVCVCVFVYCWIVSHGQSFESQH